MSSTTSPHGYDPVAYGAQCDRCPLGPNGFLRDKSKPFCPVGPEWHHGASVIAVAENPAEEEVLLGRPLVGKAGVDGWNPALAAIGRRRPDVTLTNTICCRPPGESTGAYNRMERAIKKENDRLKAEGAEPADLWPHPVDCCSPRLAWEVSHYRNVVLLGGNAAKAVLHTQQGILAIRGGPRELPMEGTDEKRKVLPTVHPSFILRAPQWRDVFERDLAKAFRWFENRRDWIEPHYVWRPSPAELRAWLRQPARYTSYDFETDSREPITAQVDCIGFGQLVEPPAEVPCEKCGGTGKRWTVLNPGMGWEPAPADQRHLECACCSGMGRRVIDVRVVCVPIRSVEDRSVRFYSPGEEEEIRQIIAEFMADPSRWKVAHNGLGYDEFVLHQWLRVFIASRRETMGLARARAPDLSKSLGVNGSIFTDIQAWKADNEGNKIANHAKFDRQLHYYNAPGDAAVTVRITDILIQTAKERGYFRPLREDIRPPGFPVQRLPWTLEGLDIYRAEMCQEMHYNGLYVDEKCRREHAVALKAEAAKYKAKAQAYAHSLGLTGPVKSKKRGPEPFNPGSDKQLAQVLFDVWGIVPKVFSEETGEASVKDEVLRDVLVYVWHEAEAEGRKPEEDPRYQFIDAVRRMKRARKAKATFVDVMQRRDMCVKEWTPRGKVLGYRTPLGELLGKEPMGWPDGKVRPPVTALLNSVGRLNMGLGLHQIPKEYRNIFCAPPIYPEDDPRFPGLVLIGGDVDQFHLRIIANLWRIGRLLEAFRDGIDPHCALAYDFFGEKFRMADGWGPDGFSLKRKPKDGTPAGVMRQLGKVIRYQGAYADVPEGIHKSVIKVEDKKTGDLPFKDVTVREVARLYKIWMRAEPEWERAWQTEMDRYVRNGGWLEESVGGRRSGSLEAGKKQAVVNYAILACEPIIFSIMECNMRTAFPFGHDGPGTGMVHQGHDAANICTRGFAWQERRGDKVKTICDEATERKRLLLRECMNVRIPGHEVEYTSDTSVGPVRRVDGAKCLSNWKEA